MDLWKRANKEERPPDGGRVRGIQLENGGMVLAGIYAKGGDSISDKRKLVCLQDSPEQVVVRGVGK
jgi:hypothetical protein